MQISLPEPKKSFEESSQVEKGGRRLHEFLAKFNHDWMMLSAAGLAYSLMIAVVPFGIAILAVLGFTLGNLNPGAQAHLVNQIGHVFPSAISSKNVLEPAITRLNKSAGFLAVLAIVTAIFGGSRLFIAIERCFDIVYRTYPRKLIAQYTMALLMMLVFIVLTPIMVLASSLPAVILSLIQSSTLSQIPGVSQLARNSFVLSAASIFGSTIVAWMLFQATYMAVPNQRISFKKSWRGAVVAAILLEFFLALFPLYITHFMSSYTGVAGFAVIFLLFFYYFALILLLGAQVNAYFAEHVAPLPNTLAVVLCDAVGRTSGAVVEPGNVTQAAPVAAPDASFTETLTASSTGAVPKARTQSNLVSGQEAARGTGGQMVPEQSVPGAASPRNASNLFGLLKQKEQKPVILAQPKKKATKKGIIAEAITGSALAFTVTFINLRRRRQAATLLKDRGPA